MTFLLIGFSVFFSAQLVRALPWPLAWRTQKPLTCNACMSGWSAIVHMGLLTSWRALADDLDLALPFLAGAGVSLLLMGVQDALQSRSWPAPPLDGSSIS